MFLHLHTLSSVTNEICSEQLSPSFSYTNQHLEQDKHTDHPLRAAHPKQLGQGCMLEYDSISSVFGTHFPLDLFRCAGKTNGLIH